MQTLLTTIISLPPHFCTAHMLAFHRRDPQQIAERVDECSIEKGLVWRDMPACLTLQFASTQVQAQLSIDGPASRECQGDFIALVTRMLGLQQDIESFEARYKQHPEVGALITRQTGLRVPLAASPFEALSWAITGQQISVSAAVSIRRKLIIATAIQHSGGLLCYPDAAQVAQLDISHLRQAGFSQTKAQTLLTLSERVINQQLPLEGWIKTPDLEQMRLVLAAVRGIGPWTINYALLRGYGWLDGSLHGDVAVRRGLQAVLKSPDSISEKTAQNYLEQFTPWRALLAAHLWAGSA